MTARWGYAAATLALLLTEVAIALFVHDRVVRPHGGDSLAVALVYCALRAVTGLRWPVALGVALAVACLIELGQLVGLLSMLGLADVRVARVVLGSGFDPADFGAYALGALGVAVVERARGR